MPTDPIVSVSGIFVKIYSQLCEILDKAYRPGDGDVKSMVGALGKGFEKELEI